jgi:hypothetical protein
LYDDGEEGNELCRACVRPYIPYAINETIDVRTEPDHYRRCHVIAVCQMSTGKSKELVYDVQLHDDDETIMRQVHTIDLRRSYRPPSSKTLPLIPLETRVVAMYRDEDGNEVDFFPGRVIQYHSSSNTYDVLYDDGDFSYNVQRDDIKLK